MRLAHDLDALRDRVTATLLAGRTPSGTEVPIRCPDPDHADEHPSASWNTEKGVWKCHGCGQVGGTVDIARLLGLIDGSSTRSSRRRPRRRPRRPTATITTLPTRMPPEHAQRLWGACSPDPASDPEAAAYLEARGLLGALSNGQIRIVPDDASLPGGAHTWRRGGYAVAMALYELDGRLASVQTRRIDARTPKSMNPRGAIKGLVFATPAGLDVLRGRDTTSPVILAEGLTDTAALSLVTDLPVIGCPGSSSATDAIGLWAANRPVLIALDVGDSSEKAVQPVADAVAARGGRPWRITWPGGANDACDVLAERGRAGLADFFTRAAGGCHDG